MKRRRHTPEQVIRKLRDSDLVVAPCLLQYVLILCRSASLRREADTLASQGGDYGFGNQPVQERQPHRRSQRSYVVMLGLFMHRASLLSEPEGLAQIVGDLGDEFRPLLEPALAAQAAALGVDRRVLRAHGREDPYGPSVRFAELLGTNDGIVGVMVEYHARRAYMLGPNEEPRVQTNAWRLILFGLGSPRVKRHLDSLAAILSERLDIEVEPFRYTSNRFKELQAEGLTSPDAPSQDEIAAARLLSDPTYRRAAISIASSGGLLVGDLPKQLPEPDRVRAVTIAQDLQAAGLVTSDLVVICSRTSDQVLRVPSQAALDRAARTGLKCACGRSVLEERSENAFSLTSLGRRLLDGSWWMTVLLMDELATLGIPHASMLVEQSQGGDEMDCFADVSGELVLFELKDKEFSLGNAYSFGAKFGIYRPAYSVVVTTAHVGGDAREHFTRALSVGQDDRFIASEQKTTTIRYIEGIDNLRPGLHELFSGIFGSDGAALLRKTLPAASLDAASLVDALASTVSPPVTASDGSHSAGQIPHSTHSE